MDFGGVEAIEQADPSFGGVVGAGGAVLEEVMARPAPAQGGPFVRIVEQPASRALRFRYECEGRSAGSIPGVNSTQDRRTYPTIEICGHTGKAIVVVSCVTKESPYKPHPHNLVGRDRCKHGVCTQRVDVTPDNRLVTFSNLGIQCVKRRDIAEALRVREELRVDPFRTGYAHRNQPQSIDLNAVRLCFQVFLPDDAGKVRHSLEPVVSEIIYDKKAMTDLQILRISRSSGSAIGGTELILLCEKVTREDVAVVMYEERREVGAGGGGASCVVWEESATVVMVHKQVAIAFTTPPYRDPRTNQHVDVYIQLKRPSDGARSVGVPFTYIPEMQGTDRPAKKPLPDLTLLSLLLAEKRDTNNNDKDALVSSTSDAADPSEESGSALIADLNGNIEIIDEAEPADVVASNEKSLNDLLDQVAELDEIYSENRTRLENVSSLNNDVEMDTDDFNDAGTYTSLQLAFKNPIQISEQEPYEDVQVHTYRGPIIEFTTLKQSDDDEKAPPLPPKRVRKTTESFKSSQTSVDSILKPGRQIPITRNPEVINRDRTELSVARSEPALPPVKKRSFFSRLFRKREKSPAPSVKSEGKKEKKGKLVGRSISSVSGQRPSKFKSSVSHASLKDNASTTGLSYADSITHISLHGDENEKSASQTSLKRPASLAPFPTDGGTILVAESVLALDASSFKKLQDDLDLTEAEHYALYMTVAPHATASEFDETSCYYSPVDGNSDMLKRKRHKTLNSTLLLQRIEQERAQWQQEQKPIKSEPSDKSPMHGTSPHRVFSPGIIEHVPDNSYPIGQWVQEAMGAGSNEPGPSNLNYPYNQEIAWTNQNYQSVSPGMGPSVSPGLQPLSPNVHTNMPAASPNLHMMQGQVMSPQAQVMSPQHGRVMSPHGQVMSPQGQVMSPQGQVMSPQGQVMSPQGQVMSPQGPTMANMQVLSPHMGQQLDARQCGMGHVPLTMGHVSPNMGNVSPNMMRQPMQQPLSQVQEMETNSTPSLTNLLNQGAELAQIQLNSEELSGLLNNYPNSRPHELTDSFHQLSTLDRM